SHLNLYDLWDLLGPSVSPHRADVATYTGAVCDACHKSTYSVLPEDYNCKVELALTSDSKTIVCYHPSLEIPYEHTKPVPRPDPVNNKEETLDQVLKSRLNEEELKNDRGLTIEELSKMFYTTKHRWYPVGQAPNGQRVVVT
uniref:Large ribosomal subunit protein mL42 n=1 Tax=Pavo cristatus TaxID=9049 RepID=A0A8C9FAQ6_PAVCR